MGATWYPCNVTKGSICTHPKCTIANLRADLARVTAERDRMRPVVEAAVRWAKVRFAGVEHMAERQLLGAAVDDYLAGEPKEGE